jgi:hypothetical protein
MKNKETLEEAAHNHQKGNYDWQNEKRLSFIAGAEWQSERMYSEEEVNQLIIEILSEIETRKQNIISNSEKMEIHLLEGGCMAFESSQDVVKEWFKQFKKK